MTSTRGRLTRAVAKCTLRPTTRDARCALTAASLSLHLESGCCCGVAAAAAAAAAAARGKLGAKCQKCPSLEITARSALLPRRNPRSGLVPSAPPTTGTRMLRRDRIAGGTPEEPHHRPERRRIYPLAPLLAPPTLHARALLSSPRRSPPPIPPAAAVSYPPSAVRARARRIMRARRLLLLPRAIPRETRRS
jgi:hypothetical protein